VGSDSFAKKLFFTMNQILHPSFPYIISKQAKYKMI